MNGSTALIKSLVAETLNTAKLDETVGKKKKKKKKIKLITKKKKKKKMQYIKKWKLTKKIA